MLHVVNVDAGARALAGGARCRTSRADMALVGGRQRATILRVYPPLPLALSSGLRRGTHSLPVA
eukprot:scaffold24935_cov63-Phaeocystis_antarctica.AAC.3